MRKKLSWLFNRVNVSCKKAFTSSPAVDSLVSSTMTKSRIFFDLAAFQRLDQRQIAVDAQAVAVEAEVELLGVEVRFLVPDGEAAQKIAVAAAAAAGLHLGLQGARPGVFAGVPAGFLHAQLRLDGPAAPTACPAAGPAGCPGRQARSGGRRR